MTVAMRIRLAILVAVSAVAVALATAAAAPAAVVLTRCPGATAADPTRCATVTVPIDRSGAVPGTIGLRVRTEAPATGAPTGTILALAGGPGQAATPIIGRIQATLKGALRTRQLVTFDQRGTGSSSPLRCPALAKPGYANLADRLSACAAEIGPQRTQYTTAASVEDVEAVRAALGVDRLILMGTSYGTKVAVAYADAYPQHVERLILDSAVPGDGVDPLGRSTIEAIPGLLRNICRDNACPFTKDPAADLTALLARLARKPITGVGYDAAGQPHRVAIDASIVLGNILGTDVAPLVRAGLPAALHSALKGDAGPLLALGGFFTPTDDEGITDALYFATTCEDGPFPWADGTPPSGREAAVSAAVAALPDDTYAPFSKQLGSVAAGIAGTCLGWPESPIAQAPFTAPTMPTLIISGNDDLRTPPADAKVLAASIPGSTLLTVPDTGHSTAGADASGCARRAITLFAAGAPVAACTTPSLRKRAIIVAPVAPARFADVVATPGLAAGVGRTVTAVRLTLDDVVPRLAWGTLAKGAVRAGGLRGGTASSPLIGAGLTLKGFSYVPGVTLTGKVGAPGHFDFSVGGRSARHGRLTLHTATGVVSGRLGGHPVRWRIPRAEIEDQQLPPSALLGTALAGHATSVLATLRRAL